MDFASEDMFNRLPNPLISHILSFLPTKEAASTSVLAKRWRLLFASVTNLDFESDDEDSPTFIAFVDRVLALQGNAPINRFSLNLTEYPDPVPVTAWILNVLRRGVSELELSISDIPFPPEVFVSKTVVKMKLVGEGGGVSFSADVAKVHLPKLKSLEMESVVFEEDGVGFVKLLSGCPLLEELAMENISWGYWKSSSVSVKSLRKLKFFCEDNDENPKSVSFDTPNLEYLEYSDNIAGKYPKVKFSSLVEAHISLRLTEDQSADAGSSEDEYYLGSDDDEVKEMVGNATNFFKGICNVQILYLSAKTLEVLAFCCEATPVFNNLIQLTVESDEEIGWDSLPGLLKNCPNLETLVFKGLVHKRTKGCGDMCLCKPLKNPSCLSSSAVKVLKIILSLHIDDEGSEVEEIKHFLERMPRLEQLVVYFNISYEPSVYELSKKLQSIPRIASPKCNVQVISPNLRLSSTLPSTLGKKWSAPPNEEYSWFLKALT